MKQRDNWLDEMPHKELHWHPLYDQMRTFDDEVNIAMQLQVKISKRIVAIRELKDESDEVLRKCIETHKWLDEQLG